MAIAHVAVVALALLGLPGITAGKGTLAGIPQDAPICNSDAPLAWPCASAIESQTVADPVRQFKRAIVVTAHPDDESMAAGLVSKLSGAGAAVLVVVLTNGDKGTSNVSITPTELARIRAAEMERAAAALNASAVLLGYEDGNLENSYEARLRVSAQIRLFRPDVLITFNPVQNLGHIQLGSEHRDHTHAGQIALDCFYPLARDHLQFKELWEPTLPENRAVLDRFPELAGWNKTEPLLGYIVPEAYLFATEKLGKWGPPRSETVFINLTTAELATMARSLAQHVSQTGGATWEALLPRILRRAAVLGTASEPPVPHAEWFTRVANLP